MASKRDFTGRIESVKDNGLKIDGVWYNQSKYFEGDWPPAKGTVVSLVLGEGANGKEYINKLVTVGSALPESGGNTPSTGSYSSGSVSGRSNDTNERIARQVALKAAIENGPGRAPAEIIVDARIFERFLAEPYGEANVEDAA